MGRIRLISKLWRELVRDGERPRQALALVREAFARVPWEIDEVIRIGAEVDRFNARRLAEDVGRTMRPDVLATLLTTGPGTPAYAEADAREIVVKKDAADDVTINGTTFRGYRKERAVVLADMKLLEEAFRTAPEGYQEPGQHDVKALEYGDLLDLNRPATMLRMTDPRDFRQAAKITALRDRGYKVVPVEVPPEQAGAVDAAFGATAPTKKAVAERAGERVVDARAWAEGIIGRGRSIERGLFASVDQVIEHGLQRGLSNDAISRTLQRSFGQAEARARFTARDRLGSLNAQITKAKHTELGFQFYRWQSANDERVRPLHRALDGEIRAWSKPHPTEGHPGDAPNCRCVAIPATVDEYNEQQRRARRPKAIAIGLGIGLLGLGLGALAMRRGVRPPVEVVPRAPAEVVPIRPITPVAPMAPIEPLRRVAQAQPPMPSQVLPFQIAPRDRRKMEARSLFTYAHRLVEGIRGAERAAGETLSNYAATWQMAIKAIRESKSNRELRERLAKLAGWGKVAPLPRKPRLIPGPVAVPGTKKKGGTG